MQYSNFRLLPSNSIFPTKSNQQHHIDYLTPKTQYLLKYSSFFFNPQSVGKVGFLSLKEKDTQLIIELSGSKIYCFLHKREPNNQRHADCSPKRRAIYTKFLLHHIPRHPPKKVTQKKGSAGHKFCRERTHLQSLWCQVQFTISLFHHIFIVFQCMNLGGV